MSDDHVKSGDLITAALWNDVVGRIELLETRVFALESDALALIISRVEPSGNLQEDDTVYVYGNNFGMSTGSTTLTIGNATFGTVLVPAGNIRPESNDKTLIFVVPKISGLPAGGADLDITVSNLTTSARVTRHFIPSLIALTGYVFADYIDTDGVGTVPSSGTFLIRFQVRSSASDAATFTLTPNVMLSDQTPTGWSATMLGSSKNVLPSSSLSLDEGETSYVYVSITIPPGTPNNTQFYVGLHAAAGLVQGTSGVVGFMTGATVEAFDATILFRLRSVRCVPVDRVTFINDVLSVQLASGIEVGAEVTFDVTVQLAGQYQSTYGGPAAWGLSRNVQPPSGTVAANSSFTVSFIVAPNTSATATFLTFGIQRVGSATVQKRIIAARLI